MFGYHETDFMRPEAKLDLNIEDIYNTMLTNSLGGTRILSMKAPAISTEFVRSTARGKAKAQRDGSLLEVEFPSDKEIEQKHRRKHGDKRLFGYHETWAADAYPAGYGQRSATSLQREDSIYQMKGSFTAAAISMSKLRARVVARAGSGDAISELFSMMWGITRDEASCIPNLTVDGSEATRLAALEDRAYHTLSCHPSVAGGYRVDMASITQEELGPNTPLNWARIRTGAKMIAQVQLTGDVEMAQMLFNKDENTPFKMTLDITADSQPTYRRTRAWETILLRAMKKSGVDSRTDEEIQPISDPSGSMEMTLREAMDLGIALNPDIQFSGSWMHIANLMRAKSRRTLENTVQLIDMYKTGRSLLMDEEEEEMEELEQSLLGKTFNVPAFKVTKDKVTSVMHKEYISGRELPDMTSHGRGKTRFSLAEARLGGIGRELTHGNALHLAVYTHTVRKNTIRASVQLLQSVKDPRPGEPGKVAFRLRDQKLYDDPAIRAIGKSLFDEAFVGSLEAIIKNLVAKPEDHSPNHVVELWNYLRGRTHPRRDCQVDGDLYELVEYLRDAPEGWTLYYWARVSIGKWSHMSQSHILAPIRAGEEVDLISAFKRGVMERAKFWENFYALQHTNLHERCKKIREKRPTEELDHTVLTQDCSDEPGKYVPPHLRKKEHLGRMYEEHDRMVEGMTRQDYERLALAQVKQKFFKNLHIKSSNRLVSVGVSDDVMREAYIESYQARWISMERRVHKAAKKGIVFTLGGRRIERNPWGPLVETFPDTLEEVREWASTLDPVGWTVHPDRMWEKLQKSISELWDDLSRELEQVMNLINETADESAEEQILQNLEHQQKLIPEELIMQNAITLPSFGYVAPYTLPSKNVTVTKGEMLSHAHYSPLSMTTSYEDGMEVHGNDDGWDDDYEEQACDEPLNGHTPFSMLSSLESSMMMADQFEVPTLTYREIWLKLGLPLVDEAKMKFSIGIPQEVDLDTEHKDSLVGPVVRADESRKAHRMWSSKLPGIAKRAGLDLKRVVKDDM